VQFVYSQYPLVGFYRQINRIGERKIQELEKLDSRDGEFTMEVKKYE